MPGNKVVAVSGGFDPLHIGHIRYLYNASKLGNNLVVILNNNDWLILKKKYFFMDEKEREEILLSIKWVNRVIVTKHKIGFRENLDICNELEILKPDIFAKGGDRNINNIPEKEICEKYNIKIIDGIGGSDKANSSSDLIKNVYKKLKHLEE